MKQVLLINIQDREMLKEEFLQSESRSRSLCQRMRLKYHIP